MYRILIILVILMLCLYSCNGKDKAEEERIKITVEQKKEEPVKNFKRESKSKTTSPKQAQEIPEAQKQEMAKKKDEKDKLPLENIEEPGNRKQRIAKKRDEEKELSIGNIRRRLKEEREYMINKGILPGDIPEVFKDLKQAKELILSDKYREAKMLMDSVHERVDQVTIDKEFIDRKRKRLAFMLKKQLFPEDAKEKIDEVRNEIEDSYNSGDYKKVNEILNREILKLSKEKSDKIGQE